VTNTASIVIHTVQVHTYWFNEIGFCLRLLRPLSPTPPPKNISFAVELKMFTWMVVEWSALG